MLFFLLCRYVSVICRWENIRECIACRGKGWDIGWTKSSFGMACFLVLIMRPERLLQRGRGGNHLATCHSTVGSPLPQGVRGGILKAYRWTKSSFGMAYFLVLIMRPERDRGGILFGNNVSTCHSTVGCPRDVQTLFHVRCNQLIPAELVVYQLYFLLHFTAAKLERTVNVTAATCVQTLSKLFSLKKFPWKFLLIFLQTFQNLWKMRFFKPHSAQASPRRDITW